jgi:hypothetical protein
VGCAGSSRFRRRLLIIIFVFFQQHVKITNRINPKLGASVQPWCVVCEMVPSSIKAPAPSSTRSGNTSAKGRIGAKLWAGCSSFFVYGRSWQMTGIELRRDRYVNMSTLLLYWHLLNATCSALCNEPGQDTSRELSRAGHIPISRRRLWI